MTSLMKKVEHFLFPCMRKFDEAIACEERRKCVKQAIRHNKNQIKEAVLGKPTPAIRVPE